MDASVEKPAVLAQRRRRELVGNELEPAVECRRDRYLRGPNSSGGHVMDELSEPALSLSFGAADGAASVSPLPGERIAPDADDRLPHARRPLSQVTPHEAIVCTTAARNIG